MTESQENVLERWAVQAFQLLYRIGGTTAELSKDVAGTVGKKAARMGITEADLSKWLQKAYGAIWVKYTNLNPGLDFKDVRKIALVNYNKPQKK